MPPYHGKLICCQKGLAVVAARSLKKRSLLDVNEHFSDEADAADDPLSQQIYSVQMRAKLMIVFIARCIVVREAYS